MSEYLNGDYRIDNNKPYLHHYDLPKDHDLVVRIAGVKKEEVKNQKGSSEEKQILYFVENVKPLILNKKVNPSAISKAIGSPDRAIWRGKDIALYEGKESKAEDGLAVRIRTDILDWERPIRADRRDATLVCQNCLNDIKDKEIDGKIYSASSIANNALSKFGKYLCYECAQKAKQEVE